LEPAAILLTLNSSEKYSVFDPTMNVDVLGNFGSPASINPTFPQTECMSILQVTQSTYPKYNDQIIFSQANTDYINQKTCIPAFLLGVNDIKATGKEPVHYY